MVGSGRHTVGLIEVEDLLDVARLRGHWSTGENHRPATDFVDSMRAWWAAENRVGWLARVDGYAVGMVNAAIFTRMPKPGRAPQRWIYVANVWVDPAFRRRGIATDLMAYAVAWARAEGMVRMVLAPSPMSVSLYESVGMRAAHDLMRLDLDPRT